MKRLFLLFAVMLCIQSSVHVQAHDFEVDGIYYNIIGEKAVEVTFKGSYVYYEEYGSTVVIPASVTYDDVTYTVTTIGEYAFYDCRYTKSITIPNSITTIKSSAFAYCI